MLGFIQSVPCHREGLRMDLGIPRQAGNVDWLELCVTSLCARMIDKGFEKKGNGRTIIARR